MPSSSGYEKDVQCPYYHEDSHRQRTRRACRLVERTPQTEQWHVGLCGSCPVPEILKANPCIHLALEARIVRKMGFLQRVEPYAICTMKVIELNNPGACWKGCEYFAASKAPASQTITVDELMRNVGDNPA
ncbi:MAG: hypothetical protein U0641_10925 [Anaerolineae bacterium]